jgi:hypothetical protein
VVADPETCGSAANVAVIVLATPLSTSGVDGALACPAITVTETVAVESRLPAGVVGDELVCCASYVLIVNVSLPATAGALAVHVNVPLELLHAGLLVLRFVAIEEGLPLNVVPFTVVSVMMTDCVLLETYCGLRLVA